MTVAELIKELQNYPDGAEVAFAYNYGDHWRTVVAKTVSRVAEEQIVHSPYHSMDRIAKDDDDGAFEVVVLR